MVPGIVKLRPLRMSVVSCPLKTAMGEMDVSSGAVKDLQDLQRRIFPESNEQNLEISDPKYNAVRQKTITFHNNNY